MNVIQVRHRGVHISILALFALDGFVSFNYVQGGYDTQAFVAAMRQMLPQVMGPYPGPLSVLVLDNCRIHHAERAALDLAKRSRSSSVSSATSGHSCLPLIVTAGRTPQTVAGQSSSPST